MHTGSGYECGSGRANLSLCRTVCRKGYATEEIIVNYAIKECVRIIQRHARQRGMKRIDGEWCGDNLS